MPDLNAADLDDATEMIKGTARSMGIVLRSVGGRSYTVRTTRVETNA